MKTLCFFFGCRKRFSTKLSTILRDGEKSLCLWMEFWSGSRVSFREWLRASSLLFSSFFGGWIFHFWHRSHSVSYWVPCSIMAIPSYQSSFLNRKIGVDLKRNCMSKLLARLSTSSCACQEQLRPSSVAARKNRHLWVVFCALIKWKLLTLAYILVPHKCHCWLSFPRIHWLNVQQSVSSLLGYPRMCDVSRFEGEGYCKNGLWSDKGSHWTIFEKDPTR